MRGSRSFLVLLVVALGLGAYIYFVESKRDLTDPATKKDKIFSVETGKIEEVEVHSASGETTTVKKTGDSWQMIAPVKADADESVVSAMVSSLETLEAQRTLEDATALAPYGLEPARFSVSFKVTGDAASHKLSVGKKTPTGSDLYARVEGQPKVFLISSYIESSLNHPTLELRDKTVLKFVQQGVDTIDIAVTGSPAVALAKKGSDWTLTAPIAARADANLVDGMLGQVSQAKMKSIVAGDAGAPSEADLKKYGLDKPQLTVTLGLGSTRATLAIGGKQPDGALYARDLSRPLVFTLDAAALTDLKKGPGDLRVKDIFEVKSFSALSVDITTGGTTYSFSKGRPAGGDAAALDVWKETKPATKDVNETAMTDFLNLLSSLKAEKFADRALPSGADTIVVARSGDAAKPVEERVTLRKSGDVVHAIKAGDPGAAIIPTADFDKTMANLKVVTDAK